MSMQYTSESKMERDLINQLVSGVSQWTERPDLRTEDDLWNNFRQKLEQNNVDVLDGVPLTELEFQQIKNQLNFPTFYDAAKWLAGENGIAKVQVQREIATLGTIRLRVINRQDIAGGISSYEVINQVQAVKRSGMDQNRRFDVTLLINGLPMIHIELKNRTHPYMDGFRQIKKYLQEGKFTGIYSCLQLFVISNGTDTRYIATAQDTKLNEQFLTKWVDESNEPVDDYINFADKVLSIPMAHKMVTQYTVIDNDKKALIALRPYQIHAIEAVKEASKTRTSGYVWHTTGSGKTLTSYKVARNLLMIPSIDKTIFIVDRVDLDQQTTASFQSYAENDVIDIDETDNVNELINRLLSANRNVIVTTIQKLHHVMRRFENKQDTPRYKKLTHLNLAFVVDECHRAISAQKKREIEQFFINSLWYGFTGTPIFAENAHAEVGELPRTTEQQYGERLHQYTVKEAIHDRAVLGFQVEYKRTISEYQLDEMIARIKMGNSRDELNPEILRTVMAMDVKDKEKLIPAEAFLSEAHMLQVVDSIVNRSRNKLGFVKGPGQTYDALLTTSSIEQAQKYYKLFKAVKNGTSKIKIDESVKKVLPDFPKVAITYSISENDETSIENQRVMKECIADYNEEFGTSYSMETIRQYNSNINDRLARKKSQYLSRAAQLDIVIVVDRLLTGFDAPCMSTLFIDRAPMQPQNLIQAFSRTNRLFTTDKKFGQIVTFQTPALFEAQVKNALILYSNGGENDVLAPTWQESRDNFVKAIEALLLIAPNVSDIVIQGASDESLRRYAKAFQNVDKAFSAIRVYSDFDESMLGTEFSLTFDKWEEYRGKYENVIDELKKRREGGGTLVDNIEFDVSYELETTHTEEINYEYIISLIQSYVPSTSSEGQEVLFNSVGKKAEAEVNGFIEELFKSNPKIATMLNEIWQGILSNPNKYKDVNISELLEDKSREARDYAYQTFARKWGVKEHIVSYMGDTYNPRNETQPGESELVKTADYTKYKEITEDPVSRLKYKRAITTDLKQMIEADILPLRRK